MKYELLKEFFLSLLRSRRQAQHFRRGTLLESVSGTGVSREVPKTLASSWPKRRRPILPRW